MAYLKNNLIGLDQLANTLTGGMPDETLSARAWRTSIKGRLLGQIARPVIDGLFFCLSLGRERGHCYQSFLSELQKRQLPKEYSNANRQD